MIRAVCILASLFFTASALPDGAPVCVIGTSNVNNAHLFPGRKPNLGKIELSPFEVSLNGVVLKNVVNERNVFFFEAGKNATLTVKSPSGKQFKGVLILLSNNRTPTMNTKANLSPIGADWEVALGCEKLPHAGFSHNNNNLKSQFDGTIFWNTTGQTLNLDVNVVEVNNEAQGSTFWFSQFKIKAVSYVQKQPCTILRLLTGRC